MRLLPMSTFPTEAPPLPATSTPLPPMVNGVPLENVMLPVVVEPLPTMTPATL